MKNESKAFQEGWQVGLAGKESVNPYQIDSDDHKEWNLGFESGRMWNNHMSFSNIDRGILG